MMNSIFVGVAILCLTIDFSLRMFAFDSFYCQGLQPVPAHFSECKQEYADTLYVHLIWAALIMRMYYYSHCVITEWLSRYEKDDFQSASSLL